MGPRSTTHIGNNGTVARGRRVLDLGIDAGGAAERAVLDGAHAATPLAVQERRRELGRQAATAAVVVYRAVVEGD